MPYHLDDNSSQCPKSKPHAVINTATGKVVPGGCHESHAKALAHLKALYANVPDAGKEQSMATPAIETSLGTVTITTGEEPKNSSTETPPCGSCDEERAWHDLDEATPVDGDENVRMTLDGDIVGRASVDNSTWDGNAAMSNCSKSSKPGSCFGSICAGRRSGPADERGSWALPHHKTPGAAPNHNGVANALSQLPKTQGLTNASAARSHLEAHMSAIGGGKKGAEVDETREDARQARIQEAAARRKAGLSEDHSGWRAGQRHQRAAPAGNARSGGAFKAELEARAELVEINGVKFRALEGYASVVGVPYEMHDMFGPYNEVIAADAFDKTLKASPDVSFLTNHKGLTMARTTNATLELSMDARGLHPLAYVNPKRTDVKDLIIAIENRMIDEMSFAFLLEDGEWSDDFQTFTIREINLDRGDVSAVNYGANPYTSVWARQREIFQDVRVLVKDNVQLQEAVQPLFTVP